MKRSKARIAKFIVFITMLLAMTLAYSVYASAAVPGDVNGDGEVDIRDAALILQYVTGHDVQLVAPCTHTGSVVLIPEVDATCTADGKSVGVYCTSS